MLAEVAPIYRALASPHYEVHGQAVIETRRGFAPHEVDEMELWLIADLLGLTAGAAQGGPGAVTEQEFRAAANALNAERIRRVNAGLPPPEAPPSATPEISDAMIGALRERRRQREADKAATGA